VIGPECCLCGRERKVKRRDSVVIMEGEEQDAFEGKERALVFVMGERNRMLLKGRKGHWCLLWGRGTGCL
jgi:hypothetical protein